MLEMLPIGEKIPIKGYIKCKSEIPRGKAQPNMLPLDVSGISTLAGVEPVNKQLKGRYANHQAQSMASKSSKFIKCLKTVTYQGIKVYPFFVVKRGYISNIRIKQKGGLFA